VLVEQLQHQPNKAAHVGHLRNAILGDTFVRLLRAAGRTVDVQNYIDNTGVQVADVIVGFPPHRKEIRAEIEALTRAALRLVTAGISTPASRSGTKLRKKSHRRAEVLHDLELGNNETSPSPNSSPRRPAPHLEPWTARHPIDFLQRERNPAPAFLGRRLERLKDEGVLAFETKQEQRLLGHARAGMARSWMRKRRLSQLSKACRKTP